MYLSPCTLVILHLEKYKIKFLLLKKDTTMINFFSFSTYFPQYALTFGAQLTYKAHIFVKKMI